MKQYSVEIVGTRPYLMHRFAEETAEKKSTKKTGRVDYRKDVQSALYRDEKGVCYVPARQIEASMAEASKDFEIPGKRGKRYTALVRSSVIVGPGDIPLEPQDWTINSVPGRIPPRTGARVMIHRPVWKTWTLRFVLDVLEDEFPAEVLKEILDTAGRRIGIGDWRPRFGQFMVTAFKELKA